MLFEHAGEMLWVFEAEEVGGFCDAFAITKAGCGLLHHEVADDDSRCLTRALTDEIPEVVGRKE